MQENDRIHDFMSRGLEQTRIGGCSCLLYATPSPECILVQPTARHEAKNLHEEVENIVRSSGKGFVFMAFDVEKWAAALMPWHDDAVSKDESVGRNAEATLGFLCREAVPFLTERYGKLPCIVGGYSLGGLFALWVSCLTDRFAAVAAASPSLWINGWADFAQTHPVKARKVYLSLGDAEEHCKNMRMARIGDCVREHHRLLSQQMGSENVTLEWNKGNHFHEEAKRMARAFVWCMDAAADD